MSDNIYFSVVQFERIIACVYLFVFLVLPICVIVDETIDMFDSFLGVFLGEMSLSDRNFRAERTASSPPTKVGIMLSTFCLFQNE